MANQKLYYEGGQTYVAMIALTDSGDHKNYEIASTGVFSNYPGKTPTIRPDGLVTGGTIVKVAVSGSDDVVDHNSISCYIGGVDKTGASSIAAGTDIAVTREVTNAYLIASIVLQPGLTVEAIEGTASATAHDLSGRGGSGQAPYIPVGAIELAQVRLTSTVAAPITADEIFQVPGSSQEMAFVPNMSIKYAREENGIMGKAGVEFVATKDLIHTGDTAAKVYAEYYQPEYTTLQNARNFEIARNTGSSSSEEYYDNTRVSKSKSLGNATFEFAPENVITEAYLKLEDNAIWHKYYPDELKPAEYMLQLGTPYFGGNEPVGGLSNYTVTVLPDMAGMRIQG